MPRLNLGRGRLVWALVLVAAVAALGFLGRGGLKGRLLNLHQGAPSGAGSSPHAASPRSPADRQAASASDGDALIFASIERLTYGPSISARLHQRIQFTDGELLGVGGYWQEQWNRGGRFHLQLRTKHDSVRFLSDGAYVWRHVTIDKEHRVTRLDLRQYARLTGHRESYDAASLPSASPLQGAISPLTLGGLPHILASLAERYRFGKVQAATLADLPVYKLVGTLSPEKYAAAHVAAAPSASGGEPPQDSATGPMVAPPQVPQRVTLHVGRDDLFPYRIVYDCTAADDAAHYGGVARSIQMQFSHVSFGGAVDGRQFEYAPPRDAGWTDVTAEVAARR